MKIQKLNQNHHYFSMKPPFRIIKRKKIKVFVLMNKSKRKNEDQ